MTIAVLENIAQVLQVPVCTFFKEKETTPNYKLNDESSVVNEMFNQNKQQEMDYIKELMKDLRDENYGLRRENEKLKDVLKENGISLNQTG